MRTVKSRRRSTRNGWKLSGRLFNVLGIFIWLVSACGEATPVAHSNSTPTSTLPSDSYQTLTIPAGFTDVTLPGTVCYAPGPVHLHQGQATIATPQGIQAGTSQVNIAIWTYAHGDLFFPGHSVTALDVWCANTGGMADGQILNTWVVFSGMSASSTVLAVLEPQQPSSVDSHIAYFDYTSGGIVIEASRIIVKEIWYGPYDETCCPTGTAKTVWTFRNGKFTPKTTVIQWAKGT